MNLTRLRSLGASALTALSLVAGATAPAVAAPPQPGWYYALGDSIAAGVGGTQYVLDGTDCGRTLDSYATDLSAKKNIGCDGATTADVLKQAKTIPPTTGRISVTVGANDLGVDALAAACLAGAPSCPTLIDDAQVAIPTLGPKIAAVIDAIRAKSPDAKIVLTGYPLLLDPSSSALAATIDGGITSLNGVIQATAAAKGAGYADVVPAFYGHWIGSADPWINAPGTPGAFHPTAAGYSGGYAPAVAAAFAALP
ncbi:SGNH/GDSL hydrolase family protein [Sinomonas atrocyanea]|uniref:SGNH/GDSL hydrolase family protein n=1 Tax=Sinomonas atrocyanea TaxID=37927 RepID=UPI00278263EC|nr:SGNH/GDSL hydrolase family protein [Sinomonas atrocyanea]MDQ0258962.1 lysophospholipase L1-like esterase [Sinomonas atrocyanea]MDR6621931.1 lysophospholipase L1-like esterase [Sinomonas atrocyanea]